jgi:hypothetical protein
VALNFGPRITSLSRHDGPEVLASLPTDLGVTASDGERVPFHGGHRLWAAPEVVEVTYAADSSACRVDIEEERLTVIGSVDEAGFVKTITVTVEDDALVVTHRLDPGPGAPERYGAWAITQLPPGGTGILPMPVVPGLQADRALVVWPYTSLADPRLEFRDDAVLVSGEGGRNLKIGVGPSPGRLAYHRDGTLFTKRFDSVAGATYPDLGAVAQVFVNDAFVELESTAPLVGAGPSVHRELWTISDCPTLDGAIEEVAASP